MGDKMKHLVIHNLMNVVLFRIPLFKLKNDLKYPHHSLWYVLEIGYQKKKYRVKYFPIKIILEKYEEVQI